MHAKSTLAGRQLFFSHSQNPVLRFAPSFKLSEPSDSISEAGPCLPHRDRHFKSPAGGVACTIERFVASNMQNQVSVISMTSLCVCLAVTGQGFLFCCQHSLYRRPSTEFMQYSVFTERLFQDTNRGLFAACKPCRALLPSTGLFTDYSFESMYLSRAVENLPQCCKVRLQPSSSTMRGFMSTFTAAYK